MWKPLVGYEGRYEISESGEVRSLKFRGVGGVHLMKTTRNYSGYHVISLGIDRKQHRLHNLVLETFVGPRPEGMHGCHNDDDKDNNQLSNLRWDTPKENCKDRTDNGNYIGRRGKITESERQDIFNRIHAGESAKKLAMEYGISDCRIYQIKNLDRFVTDKENA